VGRRARGRHDALTCLGNTLPHFFGRELEEVTGSFRESLREGGLLVVQLLNYDRILRTRERFVALGGDRRDAFLRFYDFEDGFLTLNIVHLRWEGKWVHDVSSVRLNPLRKKELGTLLSQTGFGNLTYYGDFEGSPFSRDSRDLICTAKRKP
jgi:hypothetical protein